MMPAFDSLNLDAISLAHLVPVSMSREETNRSKALMTCGSHSPRALAAAPLRPPDQLMNTFISRQLYRESPSRLLRRAAALTCALRIRGGKEHVFEVFMNLRHVIVERHQTVRREDALAFPCRHRSVSFEILGP